MEVMKITRENWGHPLVRLLADRKIFDFAEEFLFEDDFRDWMSPNQCVALPGSNNNINQSCSGGLGRHLTLQRPKGL